MISRRMFFALFALVILPSASGCRGKEIVLTELDDVFVNGESLSVIIKVSSGRDRTARGADSTRVEIDRQTFMYLHYIITNHQNEPLRPDVQKRVESISGPKEAHLRTTAGFGIIEMVLEVGRDSGVVSFVELSTGKHVTITTCAISEGLFGGLPFSLNRSRNAIIFNKNRLAMKNLPGLRDIEHSDLLLKLTEKSAGKSFDVFLVTDHFERAIYRHPGSKNIISLAPDGDEQIISSSIENRLIDAEMVDTDLIVAYRIPSSGVTRLIDIVSSSSHDCRALDQFAWDYRNNSLFFYKQPRCESDKPGHLSVERWNYLHDTRETINLHIPPLSALLQ